jgi:hypothetical protein
LFPEEHIQNKAIAVDGAPEPMLHAGDADDNFVEMPVVAAARSGQTQTSGIISAEFLGPAPDGFAADDDAAYRQHLLDHAQAQWEPKIQKAARRCSFFWREAGVNRRWNLSYTCPP